MKIAGRRGTEGRPAPPPGRPDTLLTPTPDPDSDPGSDPGSDPDSDRDTGWESGFDAFVAGRGPALLRLAYLLCGDRWLAEDLVQEVLAKAHRRWSRITAAEHPEAYVRRMVVNEHLNWRRRRATTEIIGDPPELATPDGSAASDLTDAVWAALSTLRRRQRAVIVLRYYEGLSDGEIAAVLDCAVGTVRSSASRAFAAMRHHPGLTDLDDQEARR